MSRIVVIDAGVMGLAAAYEALLIGHAADILEASPEPGGMAELGIAESVRTGCNMGWAAKTA